MHDTKINIYGKIKSRSSGKKNMSCKREETGLCFTKRWSFDIKKHGVESDSTERVKLSKRF